MTEFKFQIEQVEGMNERRPAEDQEKGTEILLGW